VHCLTKLLFEMKSSIITTLLCVLGFSTFAQNIKGTVKNTNGEAINNATISVLNTEKTVNTDRNGVFSIALRQGNYSILVNAPDFSSKIETFLIEDKDVNIEIVLAEYNSALNEVVVTADKIETKLQTTPMAISVLSAKELQAYRVWSITDLTALAPSLFTVEHGNSTSANFFNIRGTLGYTNEQAVATYVDGVYQFEFFSAPLNFNNIERIEILRGPQGTLYGRNAFGGVVNIVTKKPSNTTSGFASIDFGNYGQQRYSAGLNIPIIKDKLFFNAAAQYNLRGAVYSNPTLNTNDFDGRKAFNANFNLRYLISKRWTADLNVKTETNKDKGAYPWVGTDSIALNEPYKAFGTWANTEERNNTNAALTLRYFGEKVNFTSISASIDYLLNYPDRYDLDFTSLKFYSGNGRYKQNQITQEFRFSSAANANKLKWTVGTFAFAEKTNSDNATFYEEDFAALDPNAPYSTNTIGSRSNKGIAFFGQVNYKITSKFELSVGVRYDIEEKERIESTNLIKNNVTSVLTPSKTDKRTFSAFTPKFTANYTLSPKSMLYASFAKGYRVSTLARKMRQIVFTIPKSLITMSWVLKIRFGKIS
jgi:iron complex outermembrane recepter protein